MKYLAQLTLYTTLFIASATCSEIAIKSATNNDLDALTTLTREVIFEYFKPIIIKGYPESPIAQNEPLLDNFLNEYIALYTAEFKKTLESPDIQENNLLIATDPYNSNKVQALCLFKTNNQQIHIDWLIVAKEFRGKGIGKKLLDIAISTNDDAIQCELETLAYANEKTHAFYEKYGFTSTKELITIDPRTPNTHIRYTLQIKK
jgi:GNAT superfamily N-acetyltransferase